MAISKENLENDLSCREQSIINYSKTLTNAFVKNWIQPKKYENERLKAWFRIVLNEHGRLLIFYLSAAYCPVDKNNECEIFVQNVKKTIKQTFPVAELKSLTSDIGEDYTLEFTSKEGNEILEYNKNKNTKRD
jgi:hypothetical protein